MKRIALILSVILAACTQAEPEAVPKQSAVAILRELHREELTDWNRLTLAIALTESRCNPDALGTSLDLGILQITPIYAAEAARLTGTDYQHEDARSISKSLEMFDAVQSHYNPGRDTREAIRRHNPGAGPGYTAAVLENLALIERYEAVRAAITNSNS